MRAELSGVWGGRGGGVAEEAMGTGRELFSESIATPGSRHPCLYVLPPSPSPTSFQPLPCSPLSFLLRIRGPGLLRTLGGA